FRACCVRGRDVQWLTIVFGETTRGRADKSVRRAYYQTAEATLQIVQVDGTGIGNQGSQGRGNCRGPTMASVATPMIVLGRRALPSASLCQTVASTGGFSEGR